MKKPLKGKYRLTKVSDDKFEGNHPNFILEGMSWEGHIYGTPKIGERYHFGTHIEHARNHLFTSTVTKIKKTKGHAIVFNTRNSTYKLEKL